MESDAAPITLLVVEDDPDLAQILQELLEEEGYGVRVARTGREAFEWLRFNVPSLIVLDLLIPDIAGWEFDAKRRQDPRLAEVPVVVTSGLPPRVAAARGMKAVARLAKPYAIDDLLSIVRDHARPAAIFDPTAETIDFC